MTIKSYEYTLNMPTDHATIMLKDVHVPVATILGPLDNGLAIAQTFTHENRIRQAASSCGAAKFCVDRSVAYARDRTVFGKPLSVNQAIQWPLVELSTQIEMCKLDLGVRVALPSVIGNLAASNGIYSKVANFTNCQRDGLGPKAIREP